ncbi:MAG: VOC family protein [candidate division KSB1 bacterium]|nr:VOC family protein [candidate division KSB1 bacterium]MDZ7386393.1 VOC family protein [candidate division KSB1 bacterium]MDZ7414283.1 VOC family protein [candidate division KSB1 bacterium]
MAHAPVPFLMFEGRAEEAMRLYTSLFPDSAITHIERYGPDEQGPAGTVRRAEFTLNGQKFMCIDSPIKHEFGFTPALSLFVECADGEELRRYFDVLASGGTVLMPVDNYGFSQLFAWVNDRFGVSWQLNVW